MSVRDVCGLKHLLNILKIFNTLKLDIGNHSVIHVCINRLINDGRIEDDNIQKSTLSTLMIFPYCLVTVVGCYSFCLEIISLWLNRTGKKTI